MASEQKRELFVAHLGGAQRCISCGNSTPIGEVVADLSKNEGIEVGACARVVAVSESGEFWQEQLDKPVPAAKHVSIVLLPPTPRGRGRQPAPAPTEEEIERRMAAAALPAQAPPHDDDGLGALPLLAQNVEVGSLVGVLDMLWHWSGVVRSALDSDAAAAEEEEEAVDTSFSEIVDPSLVESMMATGFTRNQCMRALVRNNMDPEHAVEWLLQHSDDPNTDAPLTPPPKVGKKRGPFKGPDPVMFQQLRDMGFEASQASAALELTRNNFETACEMLVQGDDVIAELANKAEARIDEDSPLAKALLAEPAVHSALASKHVRDGLRVMLQDSSTITGFVYDPAIGPLLRAVLNVLTEQNAQGPAGRAAADDDEEDFED